MEAKILKIAAAVDEAGALAALPESSITRVHQGAGQDFRLERETPFSFSAVSGLCAMRKRLSEYMLALEDVQVILARSFPGVARDVLSRGGFTLYETESFAEEVLFGIWEHVLSGEGDLKDEVPAFPEESSGNPGFYFLDLRKALNANPDLTTKKILRPFFQNVSFKELAFLYDHFPPWLPEDLRNLGYFFEVENIPSGVRVTVKGGGK
ncbi:MAG: hypothetical protein LBR53_08115 [Deltaproteobacteria bacterium]|jgi:hypothetical protein|nr:hypothetical protein [Deltaproteobacteria bacterium]